MAVHPEEPDVWFERTSPIKLLEEAQEDGLEYYAGYAGAWIPGPLQIEGYADSVISHKWTDRDTRVQSRLSLGELILSDQVSAEMIFDEAALYRVRGSKEATAATVRQIGRHIISPPPKTIIGILPEESPEVAREVETYYIRRMSRTRREDIAVADGHIHVTASSEYASDIREKHARLMQHAIKGDVAYEMVQKAYRKLTR